MSFDELLKKISPVLRRITYKLGSYSRYFNADDLFQEALIHLFADYQAGKLADKTDSYILQGCYFYLRNFLRKNKEKFNLVSLDNLVNQQDEHFDLERILCLQDPFSVFEHTHCEFLINDIRNNGLTVKEKAVFEFALEGLTTREIGRRLGISHVSVVKLRKKIKEKCKKHLDDFSQVTK